MITEFTRNTQFGNVMIFPITQILREINFGDPRSALSAILTHLEALDFGSFLISALFES